MTTAAGGQEALDLAAQDVPDVMLLDLGMPGVSGFDVARAVRAAPWGAGIVLFAASGWGRDHDQQRPAEAGFDAQVVKPTDVDALNRAIGERMRRREG